MPYVLFPTAFGACGLAWGEAGITCLQLPEDTEALTERRLATRGRTQKATGGAPEWVNQIAGLIQRHLAGDLQPFTETAIDWSCVSDFQQAVYRQAQSIKPGYKRSYGDLAKALSLGPEGARAVGSSLAANPWPLIVPCHRVVSAEDKMTGFSAPGGVRTKTRLLVLEGAELLSE
jgi:methylated-DNA-[protein]-cysteine S-methyltransferase